MSEDCIWDAAASFPQRVINGPSYLGGQITMSGGRDN